MKQPVCWVRSLLSSVLLSASFIGCASTSSMYTIIEISNEADVQGCKKIGLVSGATHWGGFASQNLSLETAKKRALKQAGAKGATHVLWLHTSKGVFGASVVGKGYVCRENATVETPDTTSKIIPLSKSTAPKKDVASAHVAVMRFESGGADSAVSLVITDIFTNQIQANGKFRVMERSQMNKILNEQGFQGSGACNSTECAVEIGRLLSIDKMFIGSIGKLGESWFINIRMINVQTGEIISTLSKKIIGEVDNLGSAAIEMANELCQ